MANAPSALAESVSASFQKLHDAAGTLNNVSDELGKSITCIDESLRKLNLGITAWVEVSGWDDTVEGGFSYSSEDVGYAKINGKWGICLRKLAGNHQYPDSDSVEIWAFSDAPRIQRLQALDKIPNLLQKLSDEAATITARLQARLADVQVIADTVSSKPIQRLPIRPVTAKVEVVAGSATPNLDLIRDTVTAALEAQGHSTATVLLSNAQWREKGDGIEVEVDIKKTMLGLTMNAGAEKICREALRTIGVTRKLTFTPSAGGAK
jgi:hypothetical protein